MSEADDALNDILAASGAEEIVVPEREHIGPEEVHVTPFDEFALIPREGTGYSEPWSRRADESAEAYEKFKYYRDLGATRTQTATAEHYGVIPTSLHAAEHDWRDRALAWDSHMDRVYRLQLQESVKEMAGRHAELMVEALEHLALPFQALSKKMADDPDFMEDLSQTNTMKLFDMLVKAGKIAPSLMTAERLARGMPTEIVQADGEIRHVHELSTSEQLGEVLAILDRNHALNIGGRSGGVGEIIEAEVVEVHDDDADPETDGVSPS